MATEMELRKAERRIEQLEQLYERCKLEAKIHAQEARTANATIAEIYQVVTGATGEPGNWNGARPVIERIGQLECERDWLSHQLQLLTKEQTMNLKYRKKPVVIEAFQMTKERRTDNADWPGWMHRAWQLDRETPGSLYPTEEGTGDGTLSIGTLEGQHLVSWGDWIICGVKGELYPCKPDIFEATYEAA